MKTFPIKREKSGLLSRKFVTRFGAFRLLSLLLRHGVLASVEPAGRNWKVEWSDTQ